MVNSWGTLATIALVFIVVVFTVPPVKDKIYASSENFAKVVGLDIGKPRIGSITAVPVDSDGDNKFEMKFEVSIAGNKKDVVLEIYASRASGEAAPELKPPTPKFDPANLVVSTSKVSLAEEVKDTGGIFRVTCPHEDKSNRICTTPSNYQPDWYRFSAVLKKKGKTVYQSDALAGFYTKDYIELLDKSVQGCGDCNVVECKRKALIRSLSTDCSLYVVKVIYDRDLDRAPQAPICEYPPLNLPISDFESAFTLCSVGRINELYNKSASWVFFDSACGLSWVGMADETVDNAKKLFKTKKINNVDVAGIDIAKEATKEKLPECIRKAELAFNDLGWKFFLTKHDMEEYNIPEKIQASAYYMAQEDAKRGIDKYLESELPPIIRGLKASVTPDNKIQVSWDLPVGSNNVKNMGLAYWHRSFPSDSNEFTYGPIVVPLDKTARSYSLTPPKLTGQHRFLVTAESANPVADNAKRPKLPELEGTVQVDSEQADIGFYNNDFIELYRDLKDVDDACNKDCDVAGKKEAALGDDNLGWKTVPDKTNRPEGTYVYIARCGDNVPTLDINGVTTCPEVPGKFLTSCQLYPDGNEGEERITGCTGKEVDMLYRDVLTAYAAVHPTAFKLGKTVADLLKFDCWTEEWMMGYSRWKDTVWPVCKAKDSLRDKLNKIGWAYVS